MLFHGICLIGKLKVLKISQTLLHVTLLLLVVLDLHLLLEVLLNILLLGLNAVLLPEYQVFGLLGPKVRLVVLFLYGSHLSFFGFGKLDLHLNIIEVS